MNNGKECQKMSRIKLALDVVNDLRTLAKSIETLVHAMETKGPTGLEAGDEQAKETKKKTSTKPTEESKLNETTSEATSIEENQPTLEELRAAMAEKNRDGHREAVKAIIQKFGANNLSSMDPKYYAQAMKEVGELK
jgi:hypothetical protein